MPKHDHGPSTTLLIPLVGSSRLVDVQDGERPFELAPGVVITIPVGQRVRLENPGSEEARLLVVLSPPDFAAQVQGWPRC
jgi:quercetin dioxygenase-like cupin family protein